MSGMFDFFRTGNTKPAQQPNQQQQPNQNQGQQSQGMPANPGNFPTQGDSKSQKSGLDLFAEMMENSGSQQQTRQAPSFNIPREKLTQVASSLDFTSNIPEELLTQLQSGDMGALTSILNHVAQASYTQAMEHGMQLTDKHLGSRFDYERENMQQNIRGQVVDTQLNVEGMHPVALAMFRNTAQQLARENPSASQKEIETQVWSMMESLGGQFDRTKKAEVQKQKSQEVDWDVAGGFAPAGAPGGESGPQV